MNTSDGLSIGQRLRKEREARSWSQKMLAEKIIAVTEEKDSIGIEGIVLNISRWENDSNLPSPFYRAKLCKVFGKTADELFGSSQDENSTIKREEIDPIYKNIYLIYDELMVQEDVTRKSSRQENQKDRILHIDLEPERYGKSAAKGIYDLVQTWPEDYDFTLARGEGRIDSGTSFFTVWGQKHAVVFDKSFQQLRQEIWGEQSEQIEHELLQQMVDAELAIQPLLDNEGSSVVIAPFNAAPDTCEVFLQGGIARVKYKDTHNLGKTKNSVLAEVAAGSNMFARMYYKPQAQLGYILGLLEIDAQSQEQLDNRFAIARVIVGMGPVYLASYAMDRSINPGEHHMARTQLINLPNNLQAVNAYHQRLSANLTSGKSPGIS